MNYLARNAALICVALSCASMANAQTAFTEGRWYVSPMATYIFKEDVDRATNTSWGGHIGIGRSFGDQWAVELSLVGNSSDAYDEVNQWGLGVDLIHGLNAWGNWIPYYSVGAGMLKTNIVEDQTITNPSASRMDDTNPFVSGAAGFMRNIGSGGSSLRSEVRYRLDMADPDSYGDLMLNVGFLMPLGKAPAPPVVDSDGDGVIEGSDRCPRTAPGAAVNSLGCELDSDGDGVINSKDTCPDTRAGASVDARGCEIDSDKDGVADSDDRCPNTLRGSKVDQYGCRTIGDGDSDGVLDNRDRCPDTSPGVRVDVNGCAFGEEIRLQGVGFELNSATLTPQSVSVLDDAADTLRKHPDMKVEAQGYTDASGDDGYNLSLSERRAQAVRDYLISRGAAADNITARGYGEANPIADNGTKAGRAQNRRVTLRVQGQ